MMMDSELPAAPSQPSDAGAPLVFYFSVGGMMCQKSCGTTAQRAVALCLEEEIADDVVAVISAEVSHELSAARVELIPA
eukprot:CAMPEP_0194294960 /NCGR_PEP_ID=MMETSP0169-20130528/52249_1 /TAXON_ID=218684 /ORGANISM="Corethron pennatum, Strain L29A3" /LENGTH=78 /DNA_ID=CAMNT_0039044003 /DNA_START=191 /DNA_END=423 /DNA_ORIENTATION=+